MDSAVGIAERLRDERVRAGLTKTAAHEWPLVASKALDIDPRASDQIADVLVEEILTAALALPAGARAMLADRLLASLDGPDQKRIDALWAEEAEQRLRELEEGQS